MKKVATSALFDALLLHASLGEMGSTATEQNGNSVSVPSGDSTDRMNPAQAAAYLGVAVETLAIWRSTKRYPLRYIKVGRLVQYRKCDLDSFLISRTVEIHE